MESPLDSYKDRPVIVTGCSSGIGEAAARALSEAGAYVIGIDRKQATVSPQQFFAIDLGSKEAIHSGITRFPREIFALFNCAGLSGGAADPRTVVHVNFLGLRELTEGVVDRIPDGGAIVSAASLAGSAYQSNAPDVIGLVRTGTFEAGIEWLDSHSEYLKDRGGYPLSKEAVILYTMQRCFDLGERNVRINCVAPGITDTPMLADSKKVRGEEHFKRPPKPLGRRATALEQATIMLFLNSRWASYINGEVVWSDGGQRSFLALP